MITKFILMACGILAIAGTKALAHITYTGRDFGTLSISTNTSITNQTVTSGFGWADATDADWGDSHRGRFFRFNLTNTLTGDQGVRITVSHNLLGTGGTNTFLPGFSLFSGLAHTSSPRAHDSSALSVQWLQQKFGTNSTGLGGSGKEGSVNALGNWSIGNDPTYNTAGDPTSGLIAASLASFTYIGHAADGNAAGIVGDGTEDGFVTANFSGLAAGDYSLFVGGANYDLQNTEASPLPTYGVNVTVGLVPEPSTGSLLLGGAALLALLRRRKG